MSPFGRRKVVATYSNISSSLSGLSVIGVTRILLDLLFPRLSQHNTDAYPCEKRWARVNAGWMSYPLLSKNLIRLPIHRMKAPQSGKTR
jgi:hypothetical protein